MNRYISVKFGLSGLLGLMLLSSITFPLPNAIAHAQSEYRVTDCINSHLNKVKKKFTQGCVLKGLHAVRDNATGGWELTALHAKREHRKADIARAYKQQGLPVPSDLEKRDYRQLYGLRTDDGKTILPTIFKNVRPVSTTHSMVRMLNNYWRIVEHGTLRLTNVSGNSLIWIRHLHPTLPAYVHQVWIEEETEGKTTLRVMKPDLTFGPGLTDIDPAFGDGLTTVSSGLVVHRIDPETFRRSAEIRDVSGNITQTLDDEVAVMNMWRERDERKRASYWHIPMARVGPAPAELNAPDDSLYWPIAFDGVMERPANILGMFPLSAIKPDPTKAPTYQSWGVAFLTKDGVDYAVSGHNIHKRPHHVLKNLDKLVRVDDLRLSDDTRTIAYKPLAASGAKSGWYTLSTRTLPFWNKRKRFIHITPQVIAGNKTPKASALAAINFEPQYYLDREQAKSNARIAAANAVKAEARLRRSLAQEKLKGYETVRAADCSSVGSYTFNRFSPAAEAWKAARKYDREYACGHVPVGLANWAAAAEQTNQPREQFDLGAMFREFGRRIDSAPKYYKCTPNRDGRTENCGWSQTP